MNLQEIKNSNKYLNGITVIIHTLNSENDIIDLCKSLKKSHIDQIILSDGGSTDNTIKYAKEYVDDIVISKSGFNNQNKASLPKVKYKYLFGAEVDHRYKANQINQCVDFLKNSEFGAIQPLLRYEHVENRIKYFFSKYYEFLYEKSGKSKFISGPTVTYTELYNNFIFMDSTNNFSIDTEFSEYLNKRELGIYKIENYVEQYEDINFKNLLNKFFLYGIGDFYYTKKHFKKRNVKERIKNIFYPIYQSYKFKLFFNKNKFALSCLWYFYFFNMVRFFGLLYEFLKFNLKK